MLHFKQMNFMIWGKKVKGLNKEKNLIDTDSSMVITRGKGDGEVEEGEGEYMVTEDLT